MTFDEAVRSDLADMERSDLLRSPRLLVGHRGPVASIDGREVVVLCSNDYLGLAGSSDLSDAVARGAREHGAGAGASRHISGTAPAHVIAERKLAEFVRLPRALLFATGYAANVGSVQALAGPGDVVFSDALNHASIIDGCRLSRAETCIYPHGDVGALKRLLAERRSRSRQALVVTEAVFSMDGHLAPLAQLADLCREFGAGFVVDEAHALGVRGPSGRGLCAEIGIVPDVLVGTLGKALGLSGAFVAGREQTIELVQNRARSFVFSTAPAPAIAAAIPVAVDMAVRSDQARTRLFAHARELRKGLSELGYRLVNGDGPIIPVHVGAAAPTMRISAALLEHGVFVHGVRPPTVPDGTSRLRVTPMATHTDEHIECAFRAFSDAAALYAQCLY
jgi:8-amino-7-oxononanoate synthase